MKKLIVQSFVVAIFTLSFSFFSGFYIVYAADSPSDSSSSSDDAKGEEKKEDREYSFYCKTRFGHFLDENEEKRRDACQDGFEDKGCSDKPEENQIKKACTIGMNAPKIDEKVLSQEEVEKKSSPSPKIRTRTPSGQKMCGSAKTAYVECPATTGYGIESSSIWGLLQVLLNILLGLFAVAAVGSLVWGGIVYSSSGSDSSRVKTAMKIIKGVVIATILYIAMYSILQFLIPGGIFK